MDLPQPSKGHMKSVALRTLRAILLTVGALKFGVIFLYWQDGQLLMSFFNMQTLQIKYSEQVVQL